MVIAFFSDTGADISIAVLAASILSRNKTGQPKVIEGANHNRKSLRTLLDELANEPGHHVITLPLHCIADASVRARIDCPILPADESYDGFARALATLRNNYSAFPGLPPIWIHASQIRHKIHGNRILPISIPNLRSSDTLLLTNGKTPLVLAPVAIALAAVILAVAANPFALEIDRETLADAMFARTTPFEQTLASELLGLAHDLDDLDNAPPAMPPRMRTDRRVRTRPGTYHTRPAPVVANRYSTGA